MDKAALLERIADLREKGAGVTGSRKMHTYYGTPGDPRTAKVVSWVDPGLAGQFRAAGTALLQDMFSTQHQLYLDFVHQTSNTNYPNGFDQAVGIVKVVEELAKRDWLRSTKGLIAGEVFSDFLEMAEHLWDEKYKDAAAVIAGSSLEAHLKRLATKANVPLNFTDANQKVQPKKADTLNADLVKAGVYDKNEQKQVTAWLGVRNDAAHGDYAKVIHDVVGQMILGIRFFMSRYPA
jgi:hypothetical protein